MRKARGRARWGLLAAGALGLAGPAVAQGLAPGVPYAAGRPALVRPAAALAPVRIDQAHLTEMQVELAWLSDPALFSYQLVARASGTRLEVHGYVPSQAVREKALAVARTCGRLQVVDALTTYPSLAARPADQPASRVREAAVEVLAEEFPNQAPGFRVTAQKDGRVTVTGAVRSLEEKWKVSRCLRRVRGCTSVDNRLGWGGVGYPVVMEQPAAAPAPHANSPSPAPVIVQTAARERTPPAPPPVPPRRPPAPPVVRNPVPAPPPPAVAPAPAPSIVPTAATAPGAPPPAAPLPPLPAASPKPSLSAVPPGTPLYLLPVPSASPPAEIALRDSRPPEVPAMPRPAVAVPVTADDLHPPTKLAAAPVTKPPASSGAVLVKYEEPAPHAAPSRAAPEAKNRPAPPEAARPVKPVAPSVTAGAILLTEDRPARPAERSVAVRQAPREEKAAGGYVTTGAILISEDRPAPRAGAPVADPVARIQHSLRAACGPGARDLVVVRRNVGALEVRFTAHSQAEADQLSARMLALPELLRYQLSFQVRIEP